MRGIFSECVVDPAALNYRELVVQQHCNMLRNRIAVLDVGIPVLFYWRELAGREPCRAVCASAWLPGVSD